MKRNIKRIVAWLLVFAMMLGSNTAAVFAEEFSNGNDTSNEINIDEPTKDSSVEPEKKKSGDSATSDNASPVEKPTVAPTEAPTVAPTEAPTVAPTEAPTVEPTEAPTVAPTEEPTVAPTEEPTVAPTEEPTVESTEETTVPPTEEPTELEVEQTQGEDNEETSVSVFEQGYICVSRGTTVYKTVNGEEAGCFLNDAYVYGIVEHRAENISDDWLKIIFDTDYNRENNNSLYEGYVKGDRIKVLSQGESDDLYNRTACEVAVRAYRNLYIPSTQYKEYAVEKPTEDETALNVGDAGNPAEGENIALEDQTPVRDETAVDEKTTEDGEVVEEEETSKEADPFENGYVCISAGTMIYSSISKDDLLGMVDADSVVYVAEVIRDEEGGITWMRVSFDTPEGKTVNGYMTGTFTAVLDGENEVSVVPFTFTDEEALEKKIAIVPANTVVYAQAGDEAEIGTVIEEAAVYILEVAEVGADVWMKVSFTIPSGEMIDGYILCREDMVISTEGSVTVVQFQKAETGIASRGYLRLPAGTVVYTTEAAEEELGIIDEETTVYAELVKNEAQGAHKLYKVFFSTEDDTSYEGYVIGTELTFLEENLGLDLNEPLRPIIHFTPKERGITEGLWVYRVVNSYAEVLGYLDDEAVSLAIPNQLGGYDVNAIGEKAFVRNAALTRIYIHGNVISIAENAFSDNRVTLSGYNGTEVLRYAKRMGMPSKNRTKLDGAVLQDHVIDFSYTDDSKYTYTDESNVCLNAAEAANLIEGSIFYLPEKNGQFDKFFKVININGDEAVKCIHVEEARPEEALLNVTVDEELTPDWSGAIWAEGVEVVQEKGLINDIDVVITPWKERVVVKFTKDLAKLKTKTDKTIVSAEFEAEASFSLTGSISGNIDLVPFKLNSFDLKIDIDGQVSGGIVVGGQTGGTKVDKTQNGWFKKGDLNYIEKAGFDFLLGAVPMNGRNRETSVYVGIYVRVAVSGELKIVSKVHGTLLHLYYKDGSGFGVSQGVKWNPLSISAAVNIDLGLAAIAEAKVKYLGKIFSVDIFAGLGIEAKANLDVINSMEAEWDASTGGGTSGSAGIFDNAFQNATICYDVEISPKIEVSVSTDIGWIEKIINETTKWEKKRTGKFFALELKWKLCEWHLEAQLPNIFNAKVVESCTNSFVNVNFYTGTGESIKPLKIKNKTLIGSKAPVVVTDPNDTSTYGLRKTAGELEGWYFYEGCSGPAEYANGVGSKRKWDFNTDVVSDNMTLYAQWRSDKSYDVVYKANFTSADPSKQPPTDILQNGIEGALLTNPGQMKRPEYRFKGWYKDSGTTQEWDFDKDVLTTDKLTNGKLILYAGWEYEKGYDPNAIEQDTHGRMSFNGHSYTHIMEYKSYAEAEADAKRQGGYLCTINSAEEQAFLAKYVNNDCAQTYLWLGMTSNDGWNYWKTGEPVTYTNWESSPTASANKYNAVIRRVGGKWTTLSNQDTAHYVIEWGTPNTDPNYKKDIKSDLTFTPNGDGKTATVTGIQTGGLFDQKSVISIPSTTPNGLKVTNIADAAFKGNTRLERISIPNTVVSIGAGAFENCTKLKSVVIPNSVVASGKRVFKGCTALENVVWSTGLKTIPESMFDGCKRLATISNISSVESIQSYAFRENAAMNSFTFPANLKTIGSYAFGDNTALREVIIPDHVTHIYSYAFIDCTAVYKISIPDSVTTIDYGAFYGCRSASDVYLPKTIAKTGISSSAFMYVTGVFHVYRNTGADEWCKVNSKTVEYLGAQQKIKFSAGEGSAYEPTAKDGNMISEIYVEVGKRVTEPNIEREDMVIEGWYLEPEFITRWDFALDKVPDHNITLYAKWVSKAAAFAYSVVNGTARIRSYSGTAERVLIPDQIDGYTVTHILEGTFSGDTIKEIVVPASVSSIAPGAFDCPNLEQITLRSDKYYSVHDDGVLYLKSGRQLIYAPQGIMYTEYNVPDTVTMIRNYAFRGHDELQKCFVPDTVTSIGTGAFDRNHTVTLYGSVDSCIAKTYANSNLLPYNIYTIHYMYNGGELFTATQEAGQLIGECFEPMTDFFSFGGWYKDAQLTQEWDFDSDRMPQTDIVLYLKWDTLFDVAVVGSTINITGYRGTSTDIIIPEEIGGKRVVGIDSHAFLSSNAKTIQVPDSITTIEESAFPTASTIICSSDSTARTYAINHNMRYKDLTYTIHFEVDGGSNVADIELAPGAKTTLPVPIKSNYYFYGWYTDTSYMDSVKWTSESVMPQNDITLYACWRSASTGVTNDFAYRLLDDGTVEVTGYSGTKTVLYVPNTINGYTVTRIGEHAFEGNNTVLSITLPDTVSSIGSYAFAESAIRTVKGAKSLTEIEEGAFQGATALTSIALTTNLRTIGDYAFQRCGSLISITIPRGTTRIGAYAFNRCDYLESVSVTTTLSYLGKNAFTQCPRLKTIIVPSSLLSSAQAAFDDGVQISYKASNAVNFMKFDIIGTSISVTWNKVQNAANYAIESKRSTNKTFQRKLATTDTKATLALGAYGVTYDVKVVALDANGEVMCESIPMEAYLSRLSTPSITSVTQISSSSATMVLAGSREVDGYEVERAYSENDDFTLLKSVNSTSFQNTGLVKGFDYYYRVRAYKEGTDGERTYSRYSPVYKFHMAYKYLEAPENLQVRQTSVSAATISWDTVAGAEGYVVYRSVNGGAYRELRQTSTTSTKNTSLTKGGTFLYKVVAYFTENGQQILSKESNVVSLKVQDVATPEITEIKQNTASGVSMSWTAVNGASGYKLYKAVSPDGPFVWSKNITSGLSTTYSSGMSSGNTYYFVVRAYVNNEDGTTSYSNNSPVVSINFSSVAQVGGLTARQTAGNKAKLTWTALSGVDGYEVWTSVADNQSYEVAATSTVPTVTLNGLNDGVTYYIKICGFKGTGDEKVVGLCSDEVSVSILGSPTLQVAEQIGTTSAQLIWTKVDSADGYEIWRKTGSEEYKLVKTVTMNTATVYSLTAAKKYDFKVRPYKLDESNKKTYGFDSNVMSVYIIGGTTITSIERSGSVAVTLTWNRAEGATGYNLYRSDTVNGIYKKIKSTTELTISNAGLTKGNVYYFKIVPYKTINGVNVEGYPSAAKGIRVLEMPIINSIEQTASTTLTLTWSEVPMATSYRIYRSESATGEFTFLKKVTGATTATSINLTQNKWYYYTVVAGIDEDNTTYYSQHSSVKGAYVTSLTKPVISSVVQSSASVATITWKTVSGANGYELLKSASESGPFTSVKVLSATMYTDTSLIEGTTCYYKVRPYKTVNGTKAYGLSSDVVGALFLPAVKITALDRTASKRVDLYWNAIQGATSYNLYRSTTKDGTYKLLKTVTGTTTYNSGLALDATYYYKVAAVVSNGKINNMGPQSTAVGITLTDIGTPTITVAKQTKSACVELTWKPITNAEGYELSMIEEGDETFSKVKNVTGTTTSTSLNLIDGHTFRYRVRAYRTVNGSKEYGPYSVPVSITLMNTPVMQNLYQTASNRVEMNWYASTSASGYEVYRKTGAGSYIKLKDTTDLFTYNAALVVGTSYTYKVRAYRTVNGVTNYSGWSNEMTIRPIRYSTGTYPESAHNYSNNMNQSWSYTIEGAQALKVTFVAETAFENNYDKLYITDKNGNTVGSSYWTGTQLANKTIIVPGDTINLRMTTDGSVVRYGFAIESIVPAGQ